MSTTTTIRVRFLNDDEVDLPADTVIYAETYADTHGARCDDGSMRAIDDLLEAGTLADPDTICGGRCLDSGSYLVGTVDDIAEPFAFVD